MKNRLLEELDKFFQRKRAILEGIYDQLKNSSQIEHTWLDLQYLTALQPA